MRKCKISEINTFFAFYAEIQDGRQSFGRSRSILHHFRDKCENNFWEKLPDKSIFFGISCRNSRWPPKNAGKTTFLEKTPVYSTDVLQVKKFVNIALSHTVLEKKAFF